MPPRSGDRYRFIPTDEQRRIVEAMAAAGVPQMVIAQTIGISDRTLRKFFSVELAAGCAVASARVAQFLYGAIIGTDTQPPFRSERDRLDAAMFWLKCRAGWRATNVEIIRPVAAMTDEQIDLLLGID
jgi:hypothetical protein